MNKLNLLEKALGKEWHNLPAVIQRHYSLSLNSNSCVKGQMEIGYPHYLLPLIYLIHLCGGLVFKRGKEITTQVTKTVSKENSQLNWQRRLKYPQHKEDYFYSHMIHIKDNELVEFVRFGFGLRLLVSVADGQLIYRSNGHIWQYKNFRLTFPDWLLLGTATIIERPISDQTFRLDFSIRHPLLGISYWYQGEFNYCPES